LASSKSVGFVIGQIGDARPGIARSFNRSEAFMRWLGLAVLGLAIAGSAARAAETAPDAQDISAKAAKPAFGDWGVDLAGMDRSVKPGDDFFRYVNGTWLDKAVIPADRAGTGSFLDLSILSESRVQDIVADLEKEQTLTPTEEKVRDLYQSFVDTAQVDGLGLKPAQKDLAAIARARTHTDIARLMGSVPMGTESVFRTRINIDDKNPDSYAIFLRQSGLGLPDRDYYLIDEKNTVAARNAYRVYIGDILKLGNVADADKKASAIFDLETGMAKAQWARAERRDADKMYNPMTVSELQKLAPRFPWTAFLSRTGIDTEKGARRVIVGEKTAFPKLAAIFARTPVAVWRDYLVFHYLSAHAAYLPARFDDRRFAFYGKVLGGQNEQLDRAKRAAHFLDGEIGEGVGQIYVARYFPPEAKAKAKALVANLLAVYRKRIETADWMSAATRARALDKLARITVKIGYPDKWRDYSNYRVVAGDLLGNEERGNEFDWHRDLVRLDKPVDRSEWDMSPQTVNAYYDTSLNEIVFPAAILQPPFFDPNADEAVNYGGIGAVIGHEISHGFDDQGSKYDSSGVLKNWWTAADRKNFDARTGALAAQYSAFSPLDGMHVNGKLTLGENIADLAGVTVAQAAYHLSLNGAIAPVRDGFTGDQRFFLSYGQIWRFKTRDASARQRLLTDPHSPPRFRVNGAVRNVDAWYAAFDVKPGDRLYLAPTDRVHLW
jgi:putative endopeptidase